MRVKKSNPTPEQLSEREYAAMLFIQGYRSWRMPSIREISTAIGLSVSATHDLVKRLIEYGYLRLSYSQGRHARNIRVKRSVTPPQ